MKELVCLFTFFLGCQSFDNPPSTPIPETISKVKDMKDSLCSLSFDRVNKKGYATSKCDGLLFTTLHDIACGYISIDPFQGERGQWFRSPTHDCLGDGADSTISKDMIAGLKLHTAVRDNQQRAKDWSDYCAANTVLIGGCQIGKGTSVQVEASKTVMPPSTIKFFEDLSIRSDERSSSDNGKLPVNTEFRAHLQVINQLANGAAYGGISDNGVKLLKAQADRQPTNALYVGAYSLYMDGDMTKAAKILLSQCPTDRLPNNHNNSCTDYRYQRDKTSDLLPCKGERFKEHDATDCVFAAAVILGEVK